MALLSVSRLPVRSESDAPARHFGTLGDLRYSPSSGRFTGMLDETVLRDVRPSCSASLVAESKDSPYAQPGYRAGLEFFVLIDSTPDARALLALSGDAVVRRAPGFQDPDYGVDAVELQVQRGGEATAFVRAYTMPDCGIAVHDRPDPARWGVGAGEHAPVGQQRLWGLSLSSPSAPSST